MSGSITALAYIIIFSIIAFLLIKNDFPEYNSDIKRFFILWCIVNLLAFLSNQYWLFIIFSGGILYIHTKSRLSGTSLALFFLLLFALPTLAKEIPGFGGIRYIIDISWPRILVLSILITLLINHSKDIFKQNKLNTDRFVLLFVIYVSLLSFRETTITEGIRHIFYAFIDIYIPYLVVSRLITNKDDLKLVFITIFSSILIMSMIAVLESLKSWHLYPQLIYNLDTDDSPIRVYKYRSGLLRAYSAFGSIPLGIYITVTVGISLFLFSEIKNNSHKIIYYSILIIGLFFTLSRGPWSGLILLILSYMFLSKDKTRNIVKFSIIGLLTILVMANTTIGQRIFDLLPVVGSDKGGNISYRQQLLTRSITVINKHPFFGSVNILDDPDMQALRQGEGIIDIVNTYLQVLLQYGYIGLLLFLSIYITTLLNVLNARKRTRYFQDTNNQLLGTIFLSIIISIMFMIGTVGILTDQTGLTFHFAYLGLAISYVRMTNAIYSNPYNS